MTLVLILVLMGFGAALLDMRRRLSLAESNAMAAMSAAADAMRRIDAIEKARSAPPSMEALMRANVAKAAPWSPPADSHSDPEPAPRQEESAPVAWHAADPEETATYGSGFEDMFGRRLPIWGGGITLLVASVLLVRYSIEAGLLSPIVRTVLGLLFGTALIGLAEVSRRIRLLADDPRVAQALGGAGIGALYAATLAAANLYGLVGPGIAFAGLTLITGAALALSLRFGVPCAVLGLIGGIATPALVESDAPNIPLLAAYLALMIGGLTLLSRRQRWFWLGVVGLAGGAAWSMLLILAGGLGALAGTTVGSLVLLLGLVLPLVIADDYRGWVLQGVAGLVAALQLAVMIATGGFAMLSWGLYGLGAIGFLWLATRQSALRPMVFVPLATALILAASWPAPEMIRFATVISGAILIFGGNALWRLRHASGGAIDAAQLILLAIGGYLACHWQIQADDWSGNSGLAAIALGFFLLPAWGAALRWRRGDFGFTGLATAAALLLITAALMLWPAWLAPISIACVAGLLLVVAYAAGDTNLLRSTACYVVIATLALPVTDVDLQETASLFGLRDTPVDGLAALRWVVVMLAAAALAWRLAEGPLARSMQALAALLGYGVAAQLLPLWALAPAIALGLLAIAEWQSRRPADEFRPALVMLGLLGLGWAAGSITMWLVAAGASLFGAPMMIGTLAPLGTSVTRVFIPAMLAGIALLRLRDQVDTTAWRLIFANVGAIMLMGAHMIYKHVFAIADLAMFEEFGLAERTLWQVMLIAAGLIVWRLTGRTLAAVLLLAVALTHCLLYSLLLHDPLWAWQAVGPWPIVNLLLPMTAMPFVVPALALRMAPDIAVRIERPVAILRMGAILLFGLATLRHMFSGSMIVAMPVGPVEDIGRSVVVIVIAIGFLLWGIRQQQRDWRIASLLLMLCAVAKVFLVDASGAEGLLRIASFLALGFSLIGLGWLYSRQFRADGEQAVRSEG